jgi:hypothetical protein
MLFYVYEEVKSESSVMVGADMVVLHCGRRNLNLCPLIYMFKGSPKVSAEREVTDVTTDRKW